MAEIKPTQVQIGMVGLGVMGRNFLLNIAGHGFPVAGYDKDPEKVALLQTEAQELPVQGARDVASFISLLQPPRAVMLLVPAGPIVDNVIRDLLPHLQPGDLVIDAGNSHFTDTDLRQKTLESQGLNFMGIGISGGEEGARNGPSLMPGGPEKSYERIRGILEASAAHVDGEPCVAYLGPRSAGHYVKMVHNGIEYGMMQLIAEAYDLLNRGCDLPDAQLAEIFDQWNQSKLNGYLMEITAEIIRKVDEFTGKALVDVVLDSARQLGTGRWASQDAMTLNIPTPTIDIAVAMRNLSAQQEIRSAIGKRYGAQLGKSMGKCDETVTTIRDALYASILLTYAQGFAQLSAASQAYGYQLDLSTIARIWRGGCIIRSALLEPIRSAYRQVPTLLHLLMDDPLGRVVFDRLSALRQVVKIFVDTGIPAPAFMATLGYVDSLRAIHLPANLIQAQRDYFGAHTYERVDRRGVFHTEWWKDVQDNDEKS
jgi:6-phosphogluconate dehydrogenase